MLLLNLHQQVTVDPTFLRSDEKLNTVPVCSAVMQVSKGKLQPSNKAAKQQQHLSK